MKKIMYFLAILPLVFVSCNKDDENSNSSPITDGKISGSLKLIGENTYEVPDVDVTNEIDEIKAFAYSKSQEKNILLASAPVVNGQFSLQLPVPSAECLYIPFAEGIPEGFSVSNVSFQSTIEVVFRGYKAGIEVGNISNRTTSENTYREFVYADRDVTISGKETEIVGTTTYVDVYDQKITKGWNFVLNTLEIYKENTYYHIANKDRDGALARLRWTLHLK
jgi:hypothetical protein